MHQSSIVNPYDGLKLPAASCRECSALRQCFAATVRNFTIFWIRSLTPQQAAGNALAVAVQRPLVVDLSALVELLSSPLAFNVNTELFNRPFMTSLKPGYLFLRDTQLDQVIINIISRTYGRHNYRVVFQSRQDRRMLHSATEKPLCGFKIIYDCDQF